MKKVLFVASVVKLHIMVFHLPYLEWFKKNGYEVHVAAKNDFDIKSDCVIPNCDKYYDLSFERSPFKLNNINVYKSLKEIININDYDLIHCHTPIGGALTRFAASESRINKVKVIYTAHGFHFYKGASFFNWLVYYPIERYLSRFTDILITINKEDYTIAKTFKAKKVEYVKGVGIDLNRIQKIKVNKEEKRNQLDLQILDKVIISVGELNQNKNHKVVIKALSLISDNKVKYVICGKGSKKDELIELVNKLNLNNRVLFLDYRDDIYEILKVSDLFVFPSLREGLSLSLMEAMACGLPVICSNIRGNTDLITDKINGIVIKNNSENDYAISIENLLNNKLYIDEFSRNNVDKIIGYSLENVLFQVSKIYEDILIDIGK